MSIFSRILLLSVMLLFYVVTAHAEDVALNLAESLFESGNYEEAITEYKRFIFFNSESEKLSTAYYKIGLSYRNEGRWEESINALQQAIQFSPTESIRNEMEMALAVILIASKNYSASEFQLLKIETSSSSPIMRKKAAFFRGIVYLYTFRWEEAKKAFHIYFSNETSVVDNFSIKIDSMLSIAKDLEYKSPATAKLFSTLLPGTGQLYVGDWRNGLNALMLNALTGYILFDSLIVGNYISATTLYLPIFQRYYTGNRYHTEKIAEAYNERLNKRFASDILHTILTASEIKME